MRTAPPAPVSTDNNLGFSIVVQVADRGVEARNTHDSERLESREARTVLARDHIDHSNAGGRGADDVGKPVAIDVAGRDTNSATIRSIEREESIHQFPAVRIVDIHGRGNTDVSTDE